VDTEQWTDRSMLSMDYTHGTEIKTFDLQTVQITVITVSWEVTPRSFIDSRRHDNLKFYVVTILFSHQKD
jgi:hypothetical protein